MRFWIIAAVEGLIGRADARVKPLLRRGGRCSGEEHNHLRTYGNAVVKVGDIIIGHPDAAGRHAMADGPRLVGAVNTVEGVLVALPQVKSTSAERVIRAAGHSYA